MKTQNDSTSKKNKKITKKLLAQKNKAHFHTMMSLLGTLSLLFSFFEAWLLFIGFVFS